EAHAGNNVPVALRGVEDAASISKLAPFIAESIERPFAKIKYPDLLNARGDFLAVCANVLHRRAARCAGDSGKTLHAGISFINGPLYKGIPVFPCGDLVKSLHRSGVRFLQTDSLQRDVQHEAVESGVGDEQ